MNKYDYEFLEDEITEEDREYYDHLKNIESVQKKEMIIKKMCELYEIIEKFRKGNMLIYRPEIGSNLTREKFFNWIITNNSKIDKLLEIELVS